MCLHHTYAIQKGNTCAMSSSPCWKLIHCISLGPQLLYHKSCTQVETIGASNGHPRRIDGPNKLASYLSTVVYRVSNQHAIAIRKLLSVN